MSKIIEAVDDDGKLHRKVVQRRANSKMKHLEFSLTLLDVAKLLKKAGLKSSDWGREGGFDLARYGDIGGYEIGNCRFLSHLENMRERVLPDVEKFQTVYTYKCEVCKKGFVSIRRKAKVCSVKCRGKLPRTSSSGKPCITHQEIKQIRSLRKKGYSGYYISDVVGLSRGTVMKYWNP